MYGMVNRAIQELVCTVSAAAGADHDAFLVRWGNAAHIATRATPTTTAA